MDAILLLLALLFVVFAVKIWSKVKRYPPGPRYSLLGNLVVDNAQQTEKNVLGLKKKYGDVSSQFVFNKVAVHFNSYATIKEAYVTHGEESAGRLKIKFPSPQIANAAGLTTSEGLLWQEHRRFALSALRNFGFGRNGTEQIVQTELDFITDEFRSMGKQGKQAFNPRLTLNRATSNVISRLVFGQRAGCEKDYEMLYSKIRDNVETVGPQNLIVIAFLSRFAQWFDIPGTALHRGLTRTRENVSALATFVSEQLEQHRRDFDPVREDENLIDAYLSERHKLEAEKSEIAHSFTDDQLVRVILELFVAGTETTATTVRWGILYLVNHLEVQTKAQQEIDEVLQGRVPTLADKTRLPYTNAVTMEIARFASVAPLGGPPRRCMRTFELHGHVIPEDAVLHANLFAVHRDESIWPDPHNFNPSNFLDESGRIRNEQYLLPFGIGKRSCLGESLAKQEIFLFLCGLLQRFSMEKRAGSDEPRLNDSRTAFGNVLRIPVDFEVFMRPRDMQSANSAK